MSSRGPSFWLKTGLGAVLVVLLTVTGVVAGRKPAAANAALPLALSSTLLVSPSAHHAAQPSPLADTPAPSPPPPNGGNEGTSPPPPAPGPGLLPDGRVVLNAATEEDLRKLPRVGPSRAKSILALRTKLGKFRSVNDLLRVKGIGRKTLEHLKPKMVLDPPPAAPG